MNSVLSRLIVVALVAFAGSADRAVAQQVVAGALPGPTLDVVDATQDGEDVLELTLGVPDPGFDDFSRDAPPLWPNQAIVISTSQDASNGVERVIFGGAVNAAAAAIELEFRGAPVTRVPTLAGEAYTGRYAGRVRFFLGEVTLSGKDSDDDPVAVRMLDASGAVIGVERAPSPTVRQTVLRRRAGGALVRMIATSTTFLAPRPLAPERQDRSLCMDVAVASSVDEPEVVCQDTYYQLTLGGRRGCGRVPTTLAGFVPAAATQLDVTLGSGRKLTFATRPAPLGYAGGMVTAILPRAEAIRSAVALDASGRALVRGHLLVPPPDTRCPKGYRYEDWFFFGEDIPLRPGLPPGTETATTAGGHALVVRDDHDEFCLGVDELDLNGVDCVRPPVGIEGIFALEADPGRGVVSGFYPAQVASIDVRFEDGGRTRVPTTEGGYTGRYRGTLRFVLTPLPAGRVVRGATLFDASGRELGRTDARYERRYRPLKTALRDGPVRVRVGSSSTPLEPAAVPCFGLELGGERSDCPESVAPLDESSIDVRVPCDRRRTVVSGVARPDVRRVEIVLAGGRRVRAKTAPLPHARHRVYLAVIGARDTVTAVHFIGGRTNNGTHKFPVPGRPAVSQCGYEVIGKLY